MSRKNKKDEHLKTGAVVHWSKMTRKRTKRGKRWRYYVPVTCPDCGKTREITACLPNNFQGRCCDCAAAARRTRTSDEKLPNGVIIHWSKMIRERDARGEWSYSVPVTCVCGRRRIVGTYFTKESSGLCRECSIKLTYAKYQSENTYKEVTIPPDHPYYCMTNGNGRVLEHRLIMAQHLGRSLRRNEVVHHRNGKRGDNRLENLELCVKGKKPHPPGQRVEDIMPRSGENALVNLLTRLWKTLSK